MNFGSPVAVMLLFSLLALCAVLFALPVLRSPPPGVPLKRCTHCKFLNYYSAEHCKKCGGPVEPLDNETKEASHNNHTAQEEDLAPSVKEKK